ncbi:hypothetical protein GLP24_01185 [Photobacterium carnosum]|uniref:hypothetical protein n=1 Tax=Photobacterium carnosum TaxID=2023717 RepID=UPI001E2BE922|nr:hypothetical protein [Photobacterium carnosum]MCD9543501.1 hypothetical protein [Photobacterium carnosum]
MIAALSKEPHSIKLLCKLFETPRSSYHYRLKHHGIVTPEQALLRQKVFDIHSYSRGSAGARTIAKTWDSHIFIVGNDGIWTQACVVENGSSERKSYGCPLFFVFIVDIVISK